MDPSLPADFHSGPFLPPSSRVNIHPDTTTSPSTNTNPQTPPDIIESSTSQSPSSAAHTPSTTTKCTSFAVPSSPSSSQPSSAAARYPFLSNPYNGTTPSGKSMSRSTSLSTGTFTLPSESSPISPSTGASSNISQRIPSFSRQRRSTFSSPQPMSKRVQLFWRRLPSLMQEEWNLLVGYGLWFLVVCICGSFLIGMFDLRGFYSSYFCSTYGKCKDFQKNDLQILNVLDFTMPAFGFLFDVFPIFGRFGKPYVFLGTIIMVVGSIVIALDIPSLSYVTQQNVKLYLGFLLLGVGAIIFRVIVNALVVRNGRVLGEKGGNRGFVFVGIADRLGKISAFPFSDFLMSNTVDHNFLPISGVYIGTSALLAALSLLFKDNVKRRMGPIFERAWRLTSSILLNTRVNLPMIYFLSAALLPNNVGTAVDKLWRSRKKYPFNGQTPAYIFQWVFAAHALTFLLYLFLLRPCRNISWRFFMTMIWLGAAFVSLTEQMIVYEAYEALGMSAEMMFFVRFALRSTVNQTRVLAQSIFIGQLCPLDLEASFFASVFCILDTAGTIAQREWTKYVASVFNTDQDPINPSDVQSAAWFRFGMYFALLLLVVLMPADPVMNPYIDMERDVDNVVKPLERGLVSEEDLNLDLNQPASPNSTTTHVNLQLAQMDPSRHSSGSLPMSTHHDASGDPDSIEVVARGELGMDQVVSPQVLPSPQAVGAVWSSGRSVPLPWTSLSSATYPSAMLTNISPLRPNSKNRRPRPRQGFVPSGGLPQPDAWRKTLPPTVPSGTSTGESWPPATSQTR
ncbi:hypothetical protein BJ742DRAFT_88306 [Cladochytrium replicatum]|nr:hypothetical protein BJ742DRAFT_88306 [Cladochytrium replicatum]